MKKFSAHFLNNEKALLKASLILALILALIFMFKVQLAIAEETQASARELLKAGKILPLEKIRMFAKASKTGEILETELKYKKGIYIYEIEVLDDKSQVWELKLDAKTGQLIKMERDD